MKRVLHRLLYAFAVIVLVYACIYARQRYHETLTELEGPYQVVWIIDGDTIVLDIDGCEKRVRLIGIDTPESVSHEEENNCEEGRIAAEFTRDLLTGKQVWLEYGEEKIDRHERILAYVFLDSEGKQMVEDILLENGMACVMPIEPNTKYARHFEELENRARVERKGFQASDFWN